MLASESSPEECFDKVRVILQNEKQYEHSIQTNRRPDTAKISSKLQGSKLITTARLKFNQLLAEE